MLTIFNSDKTLFSGEAEQEPWRLGVRFNLHLKPPGLPRPAGLTSFCFLLQRKKEKGSRCLWHHKSKHSELLNIALPPNRPCLAPNPTLQDKNTELERKERKKKKRKAKAFFLAVPGSERCSLPCLKSGDKFLETARERTSPPASSGHAGCRTG